MMQLFISSAFAQEAASAAKQPAFMQFAPLVLIFVVFYFLMLRPQKKQLEEEQKLLDALTKGDEIFTKSGLLGTVVGITEKVITLEVSEGVKLKVLKSQIAGLSSKLFEKKESK
ncbi:preprotein translocase subunit YajC [Bacteriovorax sp. Seq25_V]|uniref:preprotein translocase subunit YajC n=1 Tax=Bacteriovorax sp. Seq25_V TaxID=1201288 RepID=UPI00038A0961|nr:preprotein translocase subunit YajC [Bacteriovorax sp. Seq25_V]EQC44192.1 preprotein translocase, YajC subunit [Bacteriovorax sp. Seq25_V]